MHDYHDALPGYDPARIWQDGCDECEARGKMEFAYQLSHLDPETFIRAVQRAQDWPNDMGNAESSLLRDIRAFQTASTIAFVHAAEQRGA